MTNEAQEGLCTAGLSGVVEAMVVSPLAPSEAVLGACAAEVAEPHEQLRSAAAEPSCEVIHAASNSLCDALLAGGGGDFVSHLFADVWWSTNGSTWLTSVALPAIRAAEELVKSQPDRKDALTGTCASDDELTLSLSFGVTLAEELLCSEADTECRRLCFEVAEVVGFPLKVCETPDYHLFWSSQEERGHREGGKSGRVHWQASHALTAPLPCSPCRYN